MLKHKIDLMEGKEIAPSNLILTIQEIYATLDNTFHLTSYIPWTYRAVQILLLIRVEQKKTKLEKDCITSYRQAFYTIQ